jgi:purine nucleoside phosphorylase
MTTVSFVTSAVGIDRSQFHAYEGYSLDTVVYPIRLMAALGVKDLISASHPLPTFSFSLQY